jgi:hypothetical protein
MKTLHEVFTEIQDAPTRKERQEILQANDTFTLRTVLQLNFSSDIELDIPTGNPPLECSKKNPLDRGEIIRKLVYCVKGGKYTTIKKERIFLDVVESFTEDDANIICLAKDGKIMKKYSRVSESLVASVFPTLVK